MAGEASGDTLGRRSDPCAAPSRARTLNSSASPARKCRPRDARSGSRPNRWPSWAVRDRAPSAAAAAPARTHPDACSWRRRPDVFVGIDAPEFNLRLARDLRAAGIPTVQYVSPQVWAWRQSRARSIHESVDLVLCLLPFEKRFYDEHGMRAEFVGHPLADAIPMTRDRPAARRALGIDANAQRRRPVAGKPARRSGAPGGGICRDGALARRAAPASLSSSRRWRTRRRGRFSRRRSRATRRRRCPAHRGPSPDRADRRRRGDGGLRNREPGGGAVQTSHGGGVPAGGADRLGPAPA